MELSMRSLPAQLCLTHALLHSTLRASAEILRFTLAHESLALAEARPEAPGFTISNTLTKLPVNAISTIDSHYRQTDE